MTDQRDDDRQPPWVALGHHVQGDDGAAGRREPGGQVDLPEQQHEHLGHAQGDDERGLGHQVDQVARGEEQRAPDLEEQHDRDQAEDDRQRAALPAANPLEQDPHVLADRSGHQLRRSRPAAAITLSSAEVSGALSVVTAPGSDSGFVVCQWSALRAAVGGGGRTVRAAGPVRDTRWSSGPLPMRCRSRTRGRPRPAGPGTGPRAGPRPGTRRSGCATPAGRRCRARTAA